MKLANKVVIPVSISNDLPLQLKMIKEMNFLKDCEIHFVNVFQTVTQASVLGNMSIIYPGEDDRKLFEKSIVEKLNEISQEVLPLGFSGKCLKECLFSDYPKARMADFVNDIKADLVVIPTRKKRGFFDSSFAQYINKHTNANVFFIKY